MSALGAYVVRSGVDETRPPLPMREEGLYNIGKGRAAGAAVCANDWAYLAEMYCERACYEASIVPPGSVNVNPLNMSIPGSPDYRVYHARYLAGEIRNLPNVRYYLDPDWTPTAEDGIWTDGAGASAENMRTRHRLAVEGVRVPNLPVFWDREQAPVVQGRGVIRRADDVRALFYALKRMTRLETDVAITTNGNTADGTNVEAYYHRLWNGDVFTWDPRPITIGQDALTVPEAVRADARYAAAPLFVPIVMQCDAVDGEGVSITARDGVAGTHYRFVPATFTFGGALNLASWSSTVLRAWMNELYGAPTGENDYNAVAYIAGGVRGNGCVKCFAEITWPLDAYVFTGWDWTVEES